jgi:nucleoside-diphosphate-sugar epimerase
MVEVDINTMTTTVHAVSALPKAAQNASFNLEDSWQKTRSTAANVFDFVTGRLQPYQGMSTLIQRFYRAIETGAPPPVSREQGVGVVEASDTIIEQLEIKPLRHEAIGISAPRPTARRVLVTGGTGFLGRAVVRRFVSEGFAVRVLARKLSTVDAVVQMGAEVYWGDVGDLASFQEAAAGCELIVHLAAGTSGSERDSQIATVDGTRNLLEVCRRQQPTKLVYVSSCSVYGVADHHGSAAVAETAPLERFPERRGAYSASKQEAESLVTAYMRAGGVPAVILRPGTIYGPGGELFTGMMGFSMGSTYVVIGMGGFVLPLTYVDNVADAILQSAVRAEADGEIFNVVDAERLTKRQYVNRVIRRVDPKARVFYLPYPLLYGLTWTQEMAFGLLKRHPVLTRYRLTSSQKQIVYDGRRIETRLGWKAPVRLDDALSQLVRTETTRRERPTVAPVPVAIAAPSQSLR